MAQAEHEQGRRETLSPLQIDLDPENPRLRKEERGRAQPEILRIMIQRFDLLRLAEAILASGYNDFDPILVVADNDTRIVREGNRRIATLQLLLDPTLAPTEHREVWERLSEKVDDQLREDIGTLEVRVYDDPDHPDLLTYIGYRHVSGVLTWGSLEKAGFIAARIERHHASYQDLAEELGMRRSNVERHYVAYRLVEQSKDLGIDGADRMGESFGVLLRALQTQGIPDAPACLAASVSSEVRGRLDESPVYPQESLPSPVIAVTESREDLTPVPPYEVTSTVAVPRKLPPC